MRKRAIAMATILILIYSVHPHSLLAASSFDGLFQRGNQYYQNGDVEMARDAYESIVKHGLSNAAVYYNLANCYMKLGDLGRAILNYRKAQNLDVRDRDIRTNLDIARAAVAGATRTTDAQDGWMHRVIASSGSFFLTSTVVTAWWLASGLFAGGAVSRFRRTRRRLMRAAATVFVLFLCCSVVLGFDLFDREFTEHAVAVKGPIIARSGPGDHFTEVFEQKPGFEMIVKRRQDGWAEVTLSNGYTGWVPAESLEWI